ncbi:MAG: hypothetical protein FADNKDHG_01052 [Holosporales bacterium]
MFKIIFSLFFLPSSFAFCSSNCVSLAYFHVEEECHFLDLSKNDSILSIEEEKEKLCSYLIHLQDEKLLGPRALILDELECVLGLRQNTIESFLKNKNYCLFNQIMIAIDFYYNYFEKNDPIFISKLKLNKQFFSEIMAQNKPIENQREIDLIIEKIKMSVQKKEKLENLVLLICKKNANAYPDLAYSLAVIYDHGLGEFPEGSDETQREKFIWLKKAYKNGSKQTIFTLAVCYATGKGVEKNYQKSLALFQEAASLGDKKAQMYAVKIIGSRATFENKKMDEKNLLLLKQYATEDEEIPEILSYLYENGLGEFPKESEETKKEAFKWIEYTYLHRNKTFAFHLAGLYANGTGVQKDMQKALALFQEAAALGHQLSLKYSYLTETEIAIFENKKVRSEVLFALKSDYSNDLKACSILAQVYDKGLGEFPEGSNETYQESVEWVKRAKDNEDKNAIVR